MSRLQPIYDIAELCARRGIHYAVICPGSRCAPLTLAFSRHKSIYTKTFSDERSAGFVALGIAQGTKVPSILLCTSGSAGYNFAPAVAEAFFSETPLLIFTADRPAEWIGQHDGQTLIQPGMYGSHVKKSYDLPADYDHPDSVWAINRIVNEAINLSMQEPCGPVHINTPFREPLYPKGSETFEYSDSLRTIEELPASWLLSEAQKNFLRERLPQFNRILIVAGQLDRDKGLQVQLNNLVNSHDILLVADVITNLHTVEKAIRHSDAFLGQAPDAVKNTLRPDLLITFGKSVISKNLKTFLRKYKPHEHWHIQPGNVPADTFQSVTHMVNGLPIEVFSYLNSLTREQSFEKQKQSNYTRLWEIEERRAERIITDGFVHFPEIGELELVSEVLRNLPDECNLHLANSMSVRYANIIGLSPFQRGVIVYANRGTSGIDGCTSTAVGHCLENSRPNILITGDMAFFYDRNAFWHNYPLPNLRVVVLNNHGGAIFNMIEGPATLPEAGEFFITRQKLNARKLCEEFGFDHLKLDGRRKLPNLLKDFFEFDGRTKVLEIETDAKNARDNFDNLKKKIKQTYES